MGVTISSRGGSGHLTSRPQGQDLSSAIRAAFVICQRSLPIFRQRRILPQTTKALVSEHPIDDFSHAGNCERY